MADLMDKAILLGMGLEKKAKEFLDELQATGKAEAEAKGQGGSGLTPKQGAENKVVEEGVKAAKELLNTLGEARTKLEKEMSVVAEKVLQRLNVPTVEELDVAKEMARVAREQVDLLEKRVNELEKKIAQSEDAD